MPRTCAAATPGALSPYACLPDSPRDHPCTTMLESAEQGPTLSERAYESTLRSLRTKLLKAHFALRDAKRQVIVIVSGSDGAGKGELVQRFAEWLDPRAVITHAFWDESDEEEERPHFYRFWRAMPGAGRVGIFFGSWSGLPDFTFLIDCKMRPGMAPI